MAPRKNKRKATEKTSPRPPREQRTESLTMSHMHTSLPSDPRAQLSTTGHAYHFTSSSYEVPVSVQPNRTTTNESQPWGQISANTLHEMQPEQNPPSDRFSLSPDSRECLRAPVHGQWQFDDDDEFSSHANQPPNTYSTPQQQFGQQSLGMASSYHNPSQDFGSQFQGSYTGLAGNAGMQHTIAPNPPISYGYLQPQAPHAFTGTSGNIATQQTNMQQPSTMQPENTQLVFGDDSRMRQGPFGYPSTDAYSAAGYQPSNDNSGVGGNPGVHQRSTMHQTAVPPDLTRGTSQSAPTHTHGASGTIDPLLQRSSSQWLSDPNFIALYHAKCREGSCLLRGSGPSICAECSENLGLGDMLQIAVKTGNHALKTDVDRERTAAFDTDVQDGLKTWHCMSRKPNYDKSDWRQALPPNIMDRCNRVPSKTALCSNCLNTLHATDPELLRSRFSTTGRLFYPCITRTAKYAPLLEGMFPSSRECIATQTPYRLCKNCSKIYGSNPGYSEWFNKQRYLTARKEREITGG